MINLKYISLITSRALFLAWLTKVFNSPAENSELNITISKVFVEKNHLQLELNIYKFIFAKTCKGILIIRLTILLGNKNNEVSLF